MIRAITVYFGGKPKKSGGFLLLVDFFTASATLVPVALLLFCATAVGSLSFTFFFTMTRRFPSGKSSKSNRGLGGTGGGVGEGE